MTNSPGAQPDDFRSFSRRQLQLLLRPRAKECVNGMPVIGIQVLSQRLKLRPTHSKNGMLDKAGPRPTLDVTLECGAIDLTSYERSQSVGGITLPSRQSHQIRQEMVGLIEVSKEH